MKFRKLIGLGCLVAAMAAGVAYGWRADFTGSLRPPTTPPVGSAPNPYAEGAVLDTLDGVPVYDNGPAFVVAHGRHYAQDGYYFGQKWQCVEFIKRYLYTAKGLRMADVWGNAITFFDADLAHGAFNAKRGMVQYRQGGAEKPQVGDLLVFGGVGGYGHVAIIASVTDKFVEIVQQNAPPARQRLALTAANGGWSISRSTTLGWLRAP